MQALCEDEMEMLCIDCIIGSDSHKNHKMLSVEQASEKFRNLSDAKYNKLSSIDFISTSE
jgi:hypothetical protein